MKSFEDSVLSIVQTNLDLVIMKGYFTYVKACERLHELLITHKNELLTESSQRSKQLVSRKSGYIWPYDTFICRIFELNIVIIRHHLNINDC